jgi:hypothetical protein
MAQTLPTGKAVRIPVKLVSTAGDELPFEGLVLIPEDRLILFEKLAKAARDLVEGAQAAAQNPAHVVRVERAKNAIGEIVPSLQKLWDIPQ